MRLFHFSEEPDIAVFRPRTPEMRPEIEPLVWAIDEWHAPMYYVPRQCPRACFWPGSQTTADDAARWFAGVEAKMVICVESRWLDRLRTTTLYRYEMPIDAFEHNNDESSGHYISRRDVAPIGVVVMPDLLAALAEADVELRITPSLVDLWRNVIRSTLSFSGTRLRNAQGWPADGVL